MARPRRKKGRTRRQLRAAKESFLSTEQQSRELADGMAERFFQKLEPTNTTK